MRRSRGIVASALALALAAAACSKGTPDAGRSPSPDDTGTPPPTGTASPTPGQPSGTLIAYTTSTVPSGGQLDSEFGSRASDLHLYGVGNNVVARLTRDGAEQVERMPRFRSAREISFVVNADDGSRGTVFVIGVTGGRARAHLSVNAPIVAYGWSPNGSALVYVSSGRLVLFRDGTKTLLKRLYRGGPYGREWVDQDEMSVHWSPDGRRILATDTTPLGEEPSVHVVDLTGKDVVAPQTGTFARWSKDGSSIYFQRLQDARWFQLALDGTLSQLGITPGTARPALSPDGTHLAFDDGKASPRAYVFRFSTGSQVKIGENVVAPLWVSDDRLVATMATPCAQRFQDDPDMCLGPPWWSARRAARLDIGGTGARRLALPSTLDAAVLLR